MPIPSSLNNKNLIVYYITSTGEKEKHEVIVKDGFATFETNHFSTYILAENKTISNQNINNPKTGDSFNLYIITIFLSTLLMIGTYLYLKKEN